MWHGYNSNTRLSLICCSKKINNNNTKQLRKYFPFLPEFRKKKFLISERTAFNTADNYFTGMSIE